MTAREWKPGDGDIAFISWRSQSGRSGGSAVALRCSRAYDESHWQTQTFGEIPDYKVTDVRPLVVIDPEDREQVERLAKGLPISWNLFQPDDADLGRETVDAFQAALRELAANPTPPKPEEPTGLGAVVEDAEGVRWIRTAENPEDHYGKPWQSGPVHSHWQIVDAVRVLSEGVQP